MVSMVSLGPKRKDGSSCQDWNPLDLHTGPQDAIVGFDVKFPIPDPKSVTKSGW